MGSMTADDRDRNAVANARLVHLNEQLVGPLLMKRISNEIESMCLEFKADGTASVKRIAYIAACKDLLMELEAIARTGDAASRRMNAKT